MLLPSLIRFFNIFGIKKFIRLHQGLRQNFHSATVANGETITFDKSITGPLMINDSVVEGCFFVAQWLPNDFLLGMNQGCGASHVFKGSGFVFLLRKRTDQLNGHY